MESHAATQLLDTHGPQQPWLEYSFWQGQEWVKIYIPGELRLWRQHEDVPPVPNNTYRVWKPVVPEHDDPHGNDHQRQWQPWSVRYEAWTIQDWQHQGYQRKFTRQQSFALHNASTGSPDAMQTTTPSVQVEELGPSSSLTDATLQSSLIFPPELRPLTMQRGASHPTSRVDPVSPSSERSRADRANSQSPHRFGYSDRY